MRRALLVLLGLGLGLACDPRTRPQRGQIVLFIDTNAPIAGDPNALFDSLRVDILPPNGPACPTCGRTFALDAAQFRKLDPPDEAISFGLTDAGASGYRVRRSAYRKPVSRSTDARTRRR